MEASALTIEQQYEIERGKPMPSKNHNRVQHRLNIELAKKYDETYDFLPEQDLELSTGNVVPDLCIYPNLNYDWERDEIRMTQTPITAIEILSPKQAISDLLEKARDKYFPAGVSSVWVIIPTFKTIYVMYNEKPTVAFTEGEMKDEITGISLQLSNVFR